MTQECNRGASLAAKLLAGHHWREDEKAHVLVCEECQKLIHAALEDKRKTEGPHPDSDRSRPAAQRALERARQVFQREFGISLAKEPPPSATAAKAS
jgi:hypothetical protein